MEDLFLLLSVVGALIFAVIGLIWGGLANSQMILFDGVYSFISVLLSLMTLLAAKYIRKNDQKRFPYGKLMIEPFVILIKYFIIAIIVLSAGIIAVIDLFSGGRDVSLNSAIIYSIFSTIGCFVFVIYIKVKNKQKITGFIRAEMNQWLMDGYLSLGVFIGFFAAQLLAGTNYAYIVPYIDPFMVFIVAAIFLKVPLSSIISNTREIIGMAPPESISQDIQSIVKNSEAKYGFNESFVRITKAGSGMYIDIDFIVTKHSKVSHVADQDCVREELLVKLQSFHPDPWLTITFTTDRKWAL